MSDRHELVYRSLRDLQVECSCGRWSLTSPAFDVDSDEELIAKAEAAFEQHVEHCRNRQTKLRTYTVGELRKAIDPARDSQPVVLSLEGVAKILEDADGYGHQLDSWPTVDTEITGVRVDEGRVVLVVKLSVPESRWEECCENDDPDPDDDPDSDY